MVAARARRARGRARPRARPEPPLPRRAGALGGRLLARGLPLARAERRGEQRARVHAPLARRQRGSSSASRTSRRCRARTTASACPPAAPGRRCSTPTRPTTAAPGVGNLGPGHGRGAAVARPAVLGRAHAAAARGRLARAGAQIVRSRSPARSWTTRPNAVPARVLASAGPPARRAGTGGTNFSLFSEHAERVELCLFDDDGGEERIEVQRAHRVQLALLPPGRRARAALRLPGARPLRPRDGRALQPGEAPDRPVREGDRRRRRWDAANALPYVPVGDRQTPTSTIDDARLGARDPEVAS